MSLEPLPGSYRDPSGFVFRHRGGLYRFVARSYAPHYDALIGGGLYRELVAEGLLVPHEEATPWDEETHTAHRILEPEPLAFVSYPYEWCFGQLKAAALATLEIQRRALARGMILKDASAYNLQFWRGRPVLIDTLSFEVYREGAPWTAYRQFCEHFLAPLMLMARVQVDAYRLLREYLDGIPLSFAARVLGARALLSPSALLHLNLHAMSIGRLADSTVTRSRFQTVSRRGLEGLVDGLTAVVRGLHWRPSGTQWADYQHNHAYASETLAAKRALVEARLSATGAQTVWDMGANTGEFSRLAAATGAQVIAWDADPAAVELNYRQVTSRRETSILPLVLDLTNPSPPLGWDLRERMSLAERGPADAVLALALVHHLAIGNNLPFERIAEGFARLGRILIVEYVPKQDPQAQRLLRSREDVFQRYDQATFERAFETCFRLIARDELPGSERVIYAMARRDG